MVCIIKDGGAGCARKPLTPKIFGISVNPIPTRGGGKLRPPNYYWHLIFLTFRRACMSTCISFYIPCQTFYFIYNKSTLKMKSRNLSNNKVFIIITLTKKLTKKTFTTRYFTTSVVVAENNVRVFTIMQKGNSVIIYHQTTLLVQWNHCTLQK